MRAHIDTGGMADVFLAQGTPAEGLVVVKVLREHLRGIPDVAASLRDEAHILAQLQHPHIVRLVDAGETHGCPWLALEYLEGDHLGAVRHMLRRAGRPCPPALGIQVARQAGDALRCLHTHRDPSGNPTPVVHRDVSPQNLFLKADGHVALLDLGIALHPEREAHTRTGLIKGKVAYMSPEQVNGRPLDGHSDLWSLGVVLWELLSGKRLFKDESDFEAMKKVVSAPFAPLAELRPDLPAELLQVVEGCLQRDARRRLPAAGAILDLLRPLPETQAQPAFVEEVLGSRLKKKRALVRTLVAGEALQLRLFGDLELVDEGGSSELDVGQLTPPTPGLAVHAAPAPAGELPPLPPIDPPASVPSFDALVRAEAPSLVEPSPLPAPERRPRPGWVMPLILGGSLLAAGVALVALWPSEGPSPGVQDPETPTAGTPAAAGRDQELPRTTGLVSAQEPAPRAGRRALLCLECDRGVLVHLGARRLGQTPLRDVRLSPGQHTLILEAADGARKRIELELVAGQRSRVQVSF